MENNDEISHSEIDRLENLERIINRFKIASSGAGSVLGGFGKLPKNQSELSFAERFANVQRARGKFSLFGENVSIDGNFNDGLSAS